MSQASLEARRQYRLLHWAGVRLLMNSWCSIKHWDALLFDVLPAVRFPGASARRAIALEMFGASHIAPSHRRMPHVLWTDSMNLVWNLLMGGRMGRYTGSPDTLVFDQRIDLRGFLAGSFAGLSTLHLLWKMPNVATNGKLGAIACPPQLIVTPPTDHTLHLLHYEADQLCVWKPGGHQLDQLQIRYTYVSTEGPAYKEHFGSKEHNYSHWLSLNHTAGWWDLARFLFMNPEAASSAKRDATPLRLLSWLSFRLEPAVEKLLEATMLYLSTVDEVKDSELLELGRMHLEVDTPFVSAEALRDHLIELISVRNLRHRPEALFALFRQFLQRLTLPRICHFLDLVLPQLTPSPCPLGGCYSYLMENGHPYEPRVTIAYFFTSHDHIHHVRILWGTLPLLLFSDPRMVYPVNVYDFQGQAVHRLHKQHIQLGLRKGMAVLVYYRVQGGPHANTVFQAVLIAHESAATRGKNTENRLWKRVVPSETEFAWLPPDIAWAFCSDALRRRSDCQYLAFHEAHMGLGTLKLIYHLLLLRGLKPVTVRPAKQVWMFQVLDIPKNVLNETGRFLGNLPFLVCPMMKFQRLIRMMIRNQVKLRACQQVMMLHIFLIWRSMDLSTWILRLP